MRALRFLSLDLQFGLGLWTRTLDFGPWTLDLECGARTWSVYFPTLDMGLEFQYHRNIKVISSTHIACS